MLAFSLVREVKNRFEMVIKAREKLYLQTIKKGKIVRLIRKHMARLTPATRFYNVVQSMQAKHVMSQFRNWLIFLHNAQRPFIHNTRYVDPAALAKKSKFLKEEPFSPEDVFLQWVRVFCLNKMVLTRGKTVFKARSHAKFALLNFYLT